MSRSQEEWDLYTGNIRDYVIKNIQDRFSSQTFCKELPICSSVNILKKIVNQKASIYKKPPERDFLEVSDAQTDAIKAIYDDARFDFNMLQSNRLFELQKEQTHLLIEPKNGKLTIRPIKAHNLNVVPNHIDPEVGEVYVFSAFDKQENDEKVQNSDAINSPIADQEDYKKAMERHVWWSKEYHFVTNGKGEIIHEKGDQATDEDIRNPIGVIPIVEITNTKDFNYWREISNDVAQFTVDMNADLTMLQHIVELQGFAQAYLKGPKDLMPNQIQVGPTKILKLITGDIEGGDVEFGYASPSSDVTGSMDYYLKKLALFLSSQGVDADTVSGNSDAKTYNSGLERIVAQIEKFESSRNTITLFKDAECEAFNIIKAWVNLAVSVGGDAILKDRYLAGTINDDACVEVKYQEPTAILSEMDRIELAERKQGLGTYDSIEIYATAEGVSREAAEMKLGEMNGGSSREENAGEEQGRAED